MFRFRGGITIGLSLTSEFHFLIFQFPCSEGGLMTWFWSMIHKEELAGISIWKSFYFQGKGQVELALPHPLLPVLYRSVMFRAVAAILCCKTPSWYLKPLNQLVLVYFQISYYVRKVYPQFVKAMVRSVMYDKRDSEYKS